MKNKISNFEIYDEKNVSWKYSGNKVELIFNNSIEAFFIEHLNEVIVIADINEVGANNLFVYDLTGEIKINPEMPKLNSPVEGVYTMCFAPGSDKQEVVLISEANSPYDTACTFDVTKGEFSSFHPTK